MRDPCLGGYGAFAHPHLELYDLNNRKGQNALTFLYKKGRRAKKLFAITKFESLSILHKFAAWLICLTKLLHGMFSSSIFVGKSCPSGAILVDRTAQSLARDG